MNIWKWRLDKLEEKRVISINRYEYEILLNALNEYRNSLIANGKSTEFVNQALLRLINTPIKKKSLLKRERV